MAARDVTDTGLGDFAAHAHQATFNARGGQVRFELQVKGVVADADTGRVTVYYSERRHGVGHVAEHSSEDYTEVDLSQYTPGELAAMYGL